MNGSEISANSYWQHVTANAKGQCNTTMTEQNEAYRGTKPMRTDRLVNRTTEQTSRNEEVFFAYMNFLFFIFITAPHLAHYLLPATAQSKQKVISQKAKLPMQCKERLRSKASFYSIISNNLVTL